MAVLIAAHLAAAALAPLLAGRLRSRVFLVLAVVPATAFAWLAARGGTVAGPDARSITQSTAWVDSLGMQLSFRLGTLSWVMALLVTGIGALVLVYSAYYFRPDETGLGRFSGLLTGFAGTMLGLVLADDLLLLYVFWELTTVFSYLLIGHNPDRRANRRAAMQALIVTTFGGLAMLVGVVIVGQAAGTYSISGVLADPPAGTAVSVAVVLLLVGAVSKSALVPFHFWLPAAMAAPTPVSAYLHAAAMVKAGVYVVALFAPALAGVLPWRPLLLTVGVATMLLGAWRALRQHDLKLLLAFGTVSQLGFLVVVLGVGTRSAALAGVAMLVAHALFKAALFLVVGIVDHGAGTRDLRLLSGLRRRMPVAFWAAVLAAASMAGVPPLAGFVAKESIVKAFVDVARTGDGTGIPPVAGWTVLVGLVAGSALTVAYSARFVWGAFATKPGVSEPAGIHSPPVGFAAAPALLALGGLALGFLGSAETPALAPYAEHYPEGVHHASLGLWHGLNLALVLSAVSLAAGAVMYWQRHAVARAQRGLRVGYEAEHGFRRTLRVVDRVAVEVTGATQRGSLPVYLVVIFVVVITVPGTALLMAGVGSVDLYGWDNPAQLAVGGVLVAAAILTARSGRRLKAVLLAGVTGYGMALLFMMHGAPDLALTQVLVETVTLAVFVLVLRSLPPRFSERPLTSTRWGRLGIGALVGALMAGFALVASAARTADPVSETFAERAEAEGRGHNVVNVILVDIRAWDTMGEISVLVVAATGVASLVFLITGRTGRWRPDEAIGSALDSHASSHPDGGRPSWLRAGGTLPPDRRSIVFEVVTRLAFHIIVVFSVYLLFSGHNMPGGGFAAGLVAGLALMMRYLAGGRHELNDAAPVDAGLVLGVGLFVATGTGLVPLAVGGAVLQSAVVDLSVPLLGHVHFTTSLFFDVGVYLVVVGLMLDVLRSLGSGVDRHGDESAENGRDEADEQHAQQERLGETR
ncbi:Na+/H+ antiporter subunit A [Haloactinopolyspora alba]